ncbi:2,3-bisphosphoglycerate-independent phosphoglycerate mutase [Fusibacter tunisiensis]|uniref:2,3-bisphosphoglycerate-independent phosphoglycerate mutase n=1 Tax=Fusibacter tunisiensis TaxID=1008308 RepID=A0ABS2MNW7_9FIRM|nr:2,3-bisphosphoglycerate-independent phosphoglycerate mutase [Fusibacter tunisiensis]MBM7561096.1 2,3-bisphosphoglycerate-independent phosphoglycerate mutase [Fusibacter tunisiensis]
MKKPTAIMILDGWGQNNAQTGNAVAMANTPIFDQLIEKYPNTLLAASGMDVGLPEGQMGNSEVGHLNIGAGRIIYQELTRITKSIADGDFFTNPVLVEAMQHAKINGTKLHTWGLLSDGGVHSHIDHLKALIQMAKDQGLDEIYVHAFMDGRDTSPTSGVDYIKDLESFMASINFGKIASVSGRYYSMDRDKRWERIEKSYRMLVEGIGNTSTSAVEVMQTSYEQNVTDEFIIPTVIMEDGKPVATVSENDAIVFFNFRPDRAREITRAIVDETFDGFKRPYFKTKYVGFTQYDKTIENIEIAYAQQTIENTMGTYLSGLGKTQLRIAETEKYAHVTFFFNGGVEAPNAGEDRVLINSPKVATYDLKPEMSAYELTDRLLSELDRDYYDFVIVNYANPDMVGHTGVIEAAVKAVETVDVCLGKVVAKLEEKGGAFLITADHGNAEQMLTEDGAPFTAHSINKVPLILGGAGDVKLRQDGRLSDLAPTVLELMNLDIPVEMTGKSLIK